MRTNHTYQQRGDVMELHFPKEINDFIHDLCANAIYRAIQNGTFNDVEEETEEEYCDS